MQYFKLYISGKSGKSASIARNLERALQDRCNSHHSLEVIDLLKDPGAGAEDGVLMTPSIVKGPPGPKRMVFGDMSDVAAVLDRLHVSSE